jgi:tRNA (uracil-5-)-methyltransferase
MKETRWLAQQLATELVTAHPALRGWMERRVQQHGYLASIEKCVESPVKEGYRNKCEFTVGLNPETRRLTVGFKLDPRSGGSEVGPVDHLLHVPAGMKHVVKLVESFLRAQPYQHYDPARGEGYWVSAVVRCTRQGQTMLLLTICTQQLGSAELSTVKSKLRSFFERGEGAEAGVTSLHLAERGPQGATAPELLMGRDSVTETVQGLKFHISPRAYFCINTAGAEVLVQAMASMTGVHKDMTLLDLCCGTGALGLCLGRRAGEVEHKYDFFNINKSDLQVLGVDSLPAAVEEAQRNAATNGLSHCAYIAGTVEDAVGRMVQAARHKEVTNTIFTYQPIRFARLWRYWTRPGPGSRRRQSWQSAPRESKS